MPELQRLFVTHVHELIATTVGATRDGRAIVERPGTRTVRLRPIMADMNVNLSDFDRRAPWSHGANASSSSVCCRLPPSRHCRRQHAGTVLRLPCRRPTGDDPYCINIDFPTRLSLPAPGRR